MMYYDVLKAANMDPSIFTTRMPPQYKYGHLMDFD